MGEFFEWREAPAADFAVVGDPIAQSWSPQIHSAAYRAAGFDYRYLRIRVPSGEFSLASQHLKGLGYRGLNVTAPLKMEAGGNTVDLLRDKVISTDEAGFLAALRHHGVVSGSRVLVLGAGGTARVILPALTEAGYRVSVWSRRSHELDISGIETVSEPNSGGFDVVVNATSASLSGDDLPVKWEGEGLAMELSYGLGSTPFMKAAIDAGWRAVDGREMLVQQAALSFEWWLGVAPDIEAMRRALPV